MFWRRSALTKVTEGFTGSEIEQVLIEALYRGFDQDQEPTDLTMGQVLGCSWTLLPCRSWSVNG
jgi:hypothetical protein